MSKRELYNAYLSWLDHNDSVSLQNLLDFSFTNSDIYEDDTKVVNHLFYFVPRFIWAYAARHFLL